MDSMVDFFFIKRNETVHVLVDRPGRVFLKTERRFRTFSNVWILNGILLFKGLQPPPRLPSHCLISDVFLDIRGRLEGGNLATSDFSIRAACYCEPLPNSGSGARLNHSCIPAITTTSLASPAARTSHTSNDWTFLSRPELGFFNIHIFGGLERESPPVSTEGMVCLRAPGTSHAGGTRTMTSDLPPPPTSERPGYDVLYPTMDTLTDDELLGVFSYYRLDNWVNWNTRLEWRKLSRVCRRWRYLVYRSATYLGMQILCTNGTPLLETLVHLPPLPLVIDYRDANTSIGARDELGISSALQLRYRVRNVVLFIPPSILHQVLVLMNETFPVLETLSLSSTAEDDTTLQLPKTLLAPDLRRLTLLGIGLPNKLQLLSSTPSLITLTLTNTRASGYFLPQHLITRLRSLPLLEELSIGFSIPLPRPSAERELLHELEAPVTLPVLKRLTFQGVSAYLDSLLAQIRAPLLEQLSITFFNQIAFALPHLSHFTNTTEGLRLPIAKIAFARDAFSVVADHRTQQVGDGTPSFSLRVTCRQFDWQIDCAAQICGALMTMFSGAEQLTLDLEDPGQRTSTEWQDNAVDGATWRELLGPFTGARELRVCHALVWELSCALQSDDVGLDPGLLPGLEVLAPEIEEAHAGNAFASFIEARQVAGRAVRLSPSPVSHAQPVAFPHSSTSQVSLEHSNPEANPVSYSPPPFKGPSWLRRTVLNPIRNRQARLRFADRSP
jgi:hypothetical protein